LLKYVNGADVKGPAHESGCRQRGRFARSSTKPGRFAGGQHQADV
jgi:hypothetical protein